MSKVLLIEPDRPLRNTLSTSLENAGHEVVAVSTAQAAVIACEEAQPQVVILELQLQGHGGVEFLYEFRSYAEWWSIPILLHTMVPKHVLNAYMGAFKSLNISSYAYKPATSLRELIRLVDQIVVPKL